MMICKRPVPPDDHLKEAGPQQQQQQQQQLHQQQKLPKKFLRADGRTPRPTKDYTGGPSGQLQSSLATSKNLTKRISEPGRQG